MSRYGVDSDHRGLTSDAFVILPEITTDGFMPVYPLCEHQDFSRVAGASFRGRRLTTAASLILGYGAGHTPVNIMKSLRVRKLRLLSNKFIPRRTHEFS